LKKFEKLERILLGVNASDEYQGMVDEEEEDKDFKFEI